MIAPVEFRPSDVALHAIPLPGAFGRAEREQAAAVLVRVCQVLGDLWQPVLWKQVQAVLRADAANPTATLVASWLSFPLFRPDVHDLCAKGFAERDPSTGAISLSESGLKALRRWVMPRAGERGARRPPWQFLIVPVEVNYRPEEMLLSCDGLALHRAPWFIDAPAWKVARSEISLREVDEAPAMDLQTIELRRMPLTREARFLPPERRALARRGRGRRAAIAVPMATRQRVEVFVPAGTPGPTIDALVHHQLRGTTPTVAIWRCRGWRRGALLWQTGATK